MRPPPPTHTPTPSQIACVCCIFCSFRFLLFRGTKHDYESTFECFFCSMAVSFLKVFYDDYFNIIKKIFILWAYSLIYITNCHFFIITKRQSRKHRLQTTHETPVSSTKKRFMNLLSYFFFQLTLIYLRI